MDHLLPNFKEYLQQSYTILQKMPAKIKRSHLKKDMLFVEKERGYVGLESIYVSAFTNADVPPDHIAWKSTACVYINESGDSIERPKTYTEFLLIFNQKQELLGYIKTAELYAASAHAFDTLKAYFETALDTTNSSITAIDSNQCTMIWTSGAEQLFSIKKEEIMGKDMSEFFPKAMLLNLNTLQTGEIVQNKQHEPREDLIVLINARPVRFDGNIIGAVVSETDITRQVQLRKELSSANETIVHLERKMSVIRPELHPFHSIKGSSPALKMTLDRIKQIGQVPARVLLLGESGVGKELFASAIHQIRHRETQAPFIAVNCGAIPPTLFESELFGYEKGAFSGASSQGKKGKFELAKHGTLFLDEVGELPLDMQVKLLRVLQEGTYFPVGGTKEKKVDCQIIAATNKDLNELVRKGTFREDLYFRLHIISITIPPLRERAEDIVELSHHFLFQFCHTYNKSIDAIPKSIMLKLLDYSWPGNVRELKNTVERLVVFSENDQLRIEDIFFSGQSSPDPHHVDPEVKKSPHPQRTLSLKQALEREEKRLIEQTLQSCHGKKDETADLLCISRATLYNKLNKYGISE
ncbi:sigma-54 interaction domain-containing protein [Aureibacillus halotolerans]|uniref:PAS domain S-box-containing protein n=1 Tax=Aureibacillus halotolerans TaxID=1508390 RepID=A0A4R6TVZ8_9BACI|nr:sigma 54-interacting transcriptional regulator [Aureibacillus halotolerans]TDQ35446.1 PAS domain S-box-containing protein [Aureibacillus halotolerans]